MNDNSDNFEGSTDKIQDVTTDAFNAQVLNAQGPIAVEFMSYGCSHCREIEPVLQQVAARVESTEKICRVNIAVEPDLASSYEIQGTPTLIMFLNGKQVGRIDGPSPTLSSVMTAVTQPFQT
jgi:thioredoxin 1